jgi:hypothetical protein
MAASHYCTWRHTYSYVGGRFGLAIFAADQRFVSRQGRAICSPLLERAQNACAVIFNKDHSFCRSLRIRVAR